MLAVVVDPWWTKKRRSPWHRWPTDHYYYYRATTTTTTTSTSFHHWYTILLLALQQLMMVDDNSTIIHDAFLWPSVWFSLEPFFLPALSTTLVAIIGRHGIFNRAVQVAAALEGCPCPMQWNSNSAIIILLLPPPPGRRPMPQIWLPPETTTIQAEHPLEVTDDAQK